MIIEATNRTAAITGVWTAIGLIPFDAWSEHTRFGSVLTYDFALLSALAVFFWVPVIYFVIGRSTGPFGRTWMFSPSERAEYWVCTKRMFVWVVSAAGIGSLLSIPMSLLFPQ